MNKEDFEKGLNNFEYHEYDGMNMLTFFPVKNLDRIKETVFDDEDIIVATYSKCGKISLLCQNKSSIS